MFDLERAIHRRNAATGSLAVKLSARMIEAAPEELKPVLMVKHQELAGRTMASWEASKADTPMSNECPMCWSNIDEDARYCRTCGDFV